MKDKPNLPIAFASLMLSVMLWFVVYVQNVPDPQAVNAPLAIDGLDDTKYFVRKIPTDIRLVVNAPADRVKDLSEERVTASIDLSNPQVGTHEYPVDVSPDWVKRFLDDAHPTARVEIEPMASRTLKVTSVVKGNLRDRSLQLANKRLSPTQVTLRGPESEVNAVTQVRGFLELSDIDPLNQEPQESELVPLDARGSRPQHVRTSPRYVTHYFKVVPAESTKPATIVPDLQVSYASDVLGDGYRTEPPSVTLSGPPAILTNVSKVPTSIIRYRNLDRTRTFRVRLLPPPGTTILGDAMADVIVRVRPAPNPPFEKKREVEKPVKEPAKEPASNP